MNEPREEEDSNIRSHSFLRNQGPLRRMSDSHGVDWLSGTTTDTTTILFYWEKKWADSLFLRTLNVHDKDVGEKIN